MRHILPLLEVCEFWSPQGPSASADAYSSIPVLTLKSTWNGPMPRCETIRLRPFLEPFLIDIVVHLSTIPTKTPTFTIAVLLKSTLVIYHTVRDAVECSKGPKAAATLWSNPMACVSISRSCCPAELVMLTIFSTMITKRSISSAIYTQNPRST